MSAMLANLLAKQSHRLAPVSSLMLPQTCQQVRYAKKQHTFEYAFGLPPLFTSDMYEQAAEMGKLDKLQYETIRPARIWETNSVFFDEIYDRYLRYIMYNGRRALLDRLLHDTFYEVKTIQYRRRKKLLEQERQQQAAAAANGSAAAKPPIKQLDEDEENTIETNPMSVFHKAVENCKPMVVTRKVKRGGATYQVPYPVPARESEWITMRWFNDTIKDRAKPKKTHYAEELAKELVDAHHGRGKVVKKRDELHKLAQANKAYAHYRWG